MAEKVSKKAIFASIIVLIMILIFANSQSTKPNEESQKLIPSINPDNIEKIEIIHFHGTNQCASCIAVGALAEETISTFFQNELNSGKITFAHINAELSENYELAKKYGVTGSSLWIGVYTKQNEFFKEENVNVWYKISNKESYLSYFKEFVEKRLSGDMN